MQRFGRSPSEIFRDSAAGGPTRRSGSAGLIITRAQARREKPEPGLGTSVGQFLMKTQGGRVDSLL